MISSNVRMLARAVLIGSVLLCSVLGSPNANPEFAQHSINSPKASDPVYHHQENGNHRQGKFYNPLSEDKQRSSSSYFGSLSSAYGSIVKPFEFLLPQSLLHKRQAEVDDDRDGEVSARTPSALLGLMVTVGKLAIGVGIAAGILVVINVVLTCITILIGGALVVQSLITLAGAGAAARVGEMLTDAA